MLGLLELKKLLAQVTTPEQLGVPISLVSDLILRMLFNEREVNVGRFVETIRVYPQIIDSLLSTMQREHMVEVSRAGNIRLSYTYRLTEEGSKRARDAMTRSQYIGPAPVNLATYSRVIEIQTSGKRQVTPQQVKQALNHLILPEGFDRRIGPAVNAGSSLFLYGPPGNGKTTIAQAVAKLLAGSDPVWLPFAITVGGQIIRLFDPVIHVPIKDDENSQSEQTEQDDNLVRPDRIGKVKIDKRWTLFQRPAVMVGGELTLNALDLRFESNANTYEAPLQLKANGGMFLIDDFGRQQISPKDLLNRWIVPLETGIDFLRLQSGQSLEVPFRQLIVFSTNLDPADLVDGAFLRRIQMKVEVRGPDERMFYQIFNIMCQHYKVPFDKNGFIYLLQKWYREANRPMQSVHPRDIIKTLVSICEYEGISPRLTRELVDEACNSYFVDMGPEA